MSNVINLQSIIDKYKLDADAVAKALFPNARYQKLALKRVLDGISTIDVEQLQALADLAGVFVYDLLSVNNWSGRNENGFLIFVKDNYKVRLNYCDTCLSLYKDNVCVHREIIMPNMELKDFLSHITNLTKNY